MTGVQAYQLYKLNEVIKQEPEGARFDRQAHLERIAKLKRPNQGTRDVNHKERKRNARKAALIRWGKFVAAGLIGVPFWYVIVYCLVTGSRL